MVERGLIKADQVKIVWTSDPLPNDPPVVRKGFDHAMTKTIQDAVVAMTEEQAKTIMPARYTGWIAATHASYKLIEDAGIALGRIKARQPTN